MNDNNNIIFFLLKGLTTSEAYDSCSASSQFPNGQYDCDYAFSGKLLDEPFGIWGSNGEGVGSWIEIKFKKEYQVTRISFMNRANAAERTRKLEIRFSNGNKKVVSLRNTDTLENIPITPTITRSIK